MGACSPPRLTVVTLGLALAVAGPGVVTPSLAFDFFGLWPGSKSAPNPNPSSLPYVVTFEIVGKNGPSASQLQDASSLYALRKDPPPDGDSLARRALRDFAPLVDAAWASGFYDARLSVSIEGASLPLGGGDTSAFSRAAEGYRNRAPVPIHIHVDLGQRYVLRNLQILDAHGAPLGDDQLPAKVVGLKPGDPAAADSVRAAQARIVEYFRNQGRPLAKIDKVSPLVDHPARAMDLTLRVDPDAKAGLGPLTIQGPKGFDQSIVRSYVYLENYELFSPKALADTKTSVRQIPAVGSVKIVEATQLDASGNLPLQMDVGDRALHAIGATAQYSTIDGPSAQVYWEDRNLFGGAEYLRLEATATYAPANTGPAQNFGGISDADLGGRVAAHFMKPALDGTRNDLLVDAYAERVTTNAPNFVGYTVDDADVLAALRHRFTQELSAQIGLEAQVGMATDTLGTINYRLIGVPITVTYDSTDNKLDPTRGVRASATFASYPAFMGSSLDLYQAQARVSAYYSLDSDSRYVLAGRVHVGSEFGSDLDEIPANWRFEAGGGGSVRGYAYDTLGPTAPNGDVIGGRSVFDGSAELRVKVTDTLGFVPFVDAGNAFASSAPDFAQPLHWAAGIGLRYYTAIGPIRLDVATPIDKRPGDRPIAAYISIGQSF